MLISIIVPVYKVESYLSRCVDSILNQTFTDFELILVDDGSPDNCGQICDEYAKIDSRIYVIHKENGGLSDARNAGIDWCFESSNSEWITFIDSDDWIHPRYLESLYDAAHKYNSSISVCSYKRVEKFVPYERVAEFSISSLYTERLFLEYNLEATVAWGKLYKKHYFVEVRYPFSKIHEDEYVTYRLLFQNEKVAYVSNELYYYFSNPNSITQAKWSIKSLDIIQAFSQQLAFFKKTKSREVFIFTVNKYIGILSYQYHNLSKCDNFVDKEKYIKFIRKELRKCLKQQFIKVSVSKNEQLYAIAYPTWIKLYYFYKRIKKKVNRMLDN